MKKETPISKLKLPTTKLRNETGMLKTTRAGYLLNKNGKPIQYQTNLQLKKFKH